MDRFFPNDMKPAAVDDPEVVRQIEKAAAAGLKEVKAAALAHRDISGGGLYVGLGGVALVYLRLAQQLQRGFTFAHGAYLRKHDRSRCLALAAELLGEADKLMSSRRGTSFLEGCSGLLALQALLAHMQGHQQVLADKLQAVEAVWSRHISGVLPDGECELLYGRAGYLYSLCWLQQQLGSQAVSQQLVKSVVAHILDEGLRGAAQGGGGGWQLMYAWHGKRYLGAAHGLAGILYVLLHCWPAVRELDSEAAAAAGAASSRGASRYAAAVQASVEALAAAALPSGNLPTKLGDTEDVRVAWCHGAPGLLLVLLKAAEVLGDPEGRLLAAAEAAGRDIWRRGLLRKGVGLCHGISGNGYVLLSLARATGDKQWLAQAQAFAVFAATHCRQLADTPDRPASLFEARSERQQ